MQGAHVDEDAPLLLEQPPQPEHNADWRPKPGIFSRVTKMSNRRIEYGRAVVPWPLCDNIITNTKYNIFTFVPKVLFNQFKMFSNLWYLLVALSQYVHALRVQPPLTSTFPLALVLFLTMCKEGYEDIKRWRRDKRENGSKYRMVNAEGEHITASAELRVGDLIILEKDQRVPADCLLLKTTEKNGAMFIRTDQLDGETDWKIRNAVASTNDLTYSEIVHSNISVDVSAPSKAIYQFQGRVVWPDETVDACALEQTLWTSTVVATGTNLCMVIFTGKETRAAMNRNESRAKQGLTDKEVNNASKILVGILLAMSCLVLFLKASDSPKGLSYLTSSYAPIISFVRFAILFSYIIPISMRVNLDLAKLYYCNRIRHDPEIPGTLPRSSDIPEELGRLDSGFLFSDKTGTLTKNEMSLKRVRTTEVLYSRNPSEKIKRLLLTGEPDREFRPAVDLILSFALCHNVTPVEGENGEKALQASSPDEVALVEFADTCGVELTARELDFIEIRLPDGNLARYSILQDFPFTSARKRMGIVLRRDETGEILFFMKGADSVMARLVGDSPDLASIVEEVDNMARDGLRTLIFAMRRLEPSMWDDFYARYQEAKADMYDRQTKIDAVIAELEVDLRLLGVSGVEDALQDDVRMALEKFPELGIKVWMLTGDKIETATCIARSTRLVRRDMSIFSVCAPTRDTLKAKFSDFLRQDPIPALIIDGDTLTIALEHLANEFAKTASRAAAVVACRCSPTQKAQVVELMKRTTGKRTAAIGDGGNDVGMINSADVGIGIEGKEGKQASLASDFSITQFSHVQHLISWHGLNSYMRSARLSQFVIHRGMLIAFMQMIYSTTYYYVPVSIFPGILLMGYSTVFTMAPVFCLVLDEVYTLDQVRTHGIIYQTRGRHLNGKTFFIWVTISVFQAGTLMFIPSQMTDQAFFRFVPLAFTALILIELINVLVEMHISHRYMWISEIVSLCLYVGTWFIQPDIFDLSMMDAEFFQIVGIMLLVALPPIYLVRYVSKKCVPSAEEKLMNI